MDTTMVLLFLFILVAVMFMTIVFGIIPVAAFVYVWTTLYPWLKMVGKFAAKPLNLASLVLVYVLLLAVLVFVVIQIAGSSGSTILLLFLLLLLLLVPLFIVGFLLELAIVVWYVRFIKWLFARWSGWLDVVYFSARLQLIKRKINADMRQETFRGKPGTGVRGKPGTGVRGKPTTGFKIGKKGMGFKENLDALKSEFSSAVQRARNKLSRRK